MVNNIEQIYGETFCSDNNTNLCSTQQINYYENCKSNCRSCNKIFTDNFMNRCKIDEDIPVYGHNFCINCNYYTRGNPASCVSIKSLDGVERCNYIHPGTDEIAPSCRNINDPDSEDHHLFDPDVANAEETCPEDQNYYFVAGTPADTTPRIENCFKVVNVPVETSTTQANASGTSGTSGTR